MAALGIFFQKIFDTNLICRHQGGKNQEDQSTIVLSAFKIDMPKVPIFFQIFHSLVPKIKICLKYFLDKNTQKRSLWAGRKKI